MSRKRPYCLTIGGFDPSGGAGILADIKTFEQHKVYGMAVNTANTIQNDEEFTAVNWLDEKMILAQLDILLKKHTFEYIKIGLIPSFDLIDKIKTKCQSELVEDQNSQLTTHNSTLILDPILKSSSGFDLSQNVEILKKHLNKLEFLTPNWEEMKQISGNENAIEGAKELSKHCKIYLKGGHNPEEPGRDYLFVDGKQYNFRPKGKKVTEKHGSGCVFSSALAANLALGFPLIKACLRAKSYTTGILESNKTKLGYHKR